MSCQAPKHYVATLHSRFLKLGGTVYVSTAVKRLLLDADDRCVIGVIAEMHARETEFHARRGVILAAGDYAHSPELIARFKGEQFSAIEGINPFANGDGHRLAEQVGAKLVNMDITYGPELRFVPPPGRTFQQLLPAGGTAARCLGWLLPLVPQFVMNTMIRRLLVTWQHPRRRVATRRSYPGQSKQRAVLRRNRLA